MILQEKTRPGRLAPSGADLAQKIEVAVRP